MTKRKPRVDTVAIQAALADKPSLASVPRDLTSIIQPLVKDRWLGLIRRNYSADNVRSILESSNGQRMFMLHSMYELMEETWPRVGKNLHEVRSAVANLEWSVTPYAKKGEKPTPAAQEKARFMEDMFFGMRTNPINGQAGPTDLVYDMMDAYGKGLCVNEIDWERAAGGIYKPKGTRWVRSVYFDYPISSLETERLMLDPTGTGIGLQDFPANKFIIGRFNWRSNSLASKAGLLRLLAPWWVYTNFGTEWLLQFAQIFGMPIRWCNYQRESDMPVVSEMLENLGAAAWGAFPQGTDLKLHESSKSASDNPQAYLLERTDLLADLIILGNTLTSQARNSGGGGSLALGEVHERVEHRRVIHAGKWCGVGLTDQLARPCLMLNYGNDDECPTISPVIDDPKDPKAMAERDKILFVDMGLPVSKEYLYERHQVPPPIEGGDLFDGPEPKEVAIPGQTPPQDANPPDEAPAGIPPASNAEPGKPGARSRVNIATVTALEGLNVPEDVIEALERLPEPVREHYISAIHAGQPHFKGGQKGGGQFMRTAIADAQEKLRALAVKWPAEGQHRARRHVLAFGMPDNEAEFRAYNSAGLADRVDTLARKVKKTVKVKLADLRTTQSTIDTEKVMAMLSSADTSAEPVNRTPIVIKRSNKLWIWDGHHRIAKERLFGRDEVSARMVNTDEPE